MEMMKKVSMILLVVALVVATRPTTMANEPGLGELGQGQLVRLSITATLYYDIPFGQIMEFAAAAAAAAAADKSNGGALTCKNVGQGCNVASPCCAGLWCDNPMLVLGVCKFKVDKPSMQQP